MKRRIAGILLCLIWLASFLPTAGEAARAADRLLSLSRNTSGARYFVDSTGKTVRLTGPFLRQSELGEQSVEQLAEQWRAKGANAVRLGLDITATGEDKIEACGGYTEEGINAYIDRYVDGDVQAILQGGLYVVLTLCEMPEQKNVEQALLTASTRYLPLWVQLAQRYGDEAMIAAFDLWDEPLFAVQEDEKGRAALTDYFVDCIDTLRLYDEKHIFIVSDWNGGVGTAFASQWQNELHRVDPVFRNTAFSIHTTEEEFGLSYSYYGSWWNATAVEKNICLFFGRVTLPEAGINEAAQQNMLQTLTEPCNACIFVSCDATMPIPSVWLEGVKQATEQVEDRRFVYEAEGVPQADYLIFEQTDGAFGQTVSLSEQAADRAVVLDSGYMFPVGLYQLRVRYRADENAAPLCIGYTTADAKVVPLAVLSYVADGFVEADLTLHTTQAFVDIVLWRQPDTSGNTVQVDRIILRSEGAVIPTPKTQAGITTVPHGVSLSTAAAAAIQSSESSSHGWKTVLWVLGGTVLLVALAVGWLLFLGRNYQTEAIRTEEKEGTDDEPTQE